MVKQLSIFLENKSGSLAKVTEILARENINIMAFSVSDATEYGILRMVVSNPDNAYSILKSKNYSVLTSEVVAVKLVDGTGELFKVLDVIAETQTGIDYIYSFAASTNKSVVIIHSNDNADLNKILSDKGFDLY